MMSKMFFCKYTENTPLQLFGAPGQPLDAWPIWSLCKSYALFGCCFFSAVLDRLLAPPCGTKGLSHTSCFLAISRTNSITSTISFFIYLFIFNAFKKKHKCVPLLMLFSNIPNGKEHIRWPFASGYTELCDNSSLQRSVLWSVSSALSWLYQIVSSEVQYLAHKLPKVPRANWADVSNCLGGWLCRRVAEIEKQKKGDGKRVKGGVKPI